jgi:hypothetical protein
MCNDIVTIRAALIVSAPAKQRSDDRLFCIRHSDLFA